MSEIDTRAEEVARKNKESQGQCQALGTRPGTMQCRTTARWIVGSDLVRACDDHLSRVTSVVAAVGGPVAVVRVGGAQTPLATPDEALDRAGIPMSLRRLQDAYSPVAERIDALARRSGELDRLNVWLDAAKLTAIATLAAHGVSFLDAVRALWSVYGTRWSGDLSAPPDEFDIAPLLQTPVVLWADRPASSVRVQGKCTVWRGPCACGSWHLDDGGHQQSDIDRADQWRALDERMGWDPELRRIQTMISGRTE